MAAKTFIDNLGASIYKEYSSALSHDDIKLSFKEIVQKLPKGPLRKKLKKNFNKYSSRLEKHIAQLSGTDLPTPPPEVQEESLHELSCTIDHRHEVGESSRLDHTLIFNMLKQAPDLPSQEMLKDFTNDQKRGIYSLYLQQGLVRRDVGYEKLKKIIDKLDQVIPKQSKSKEKASNFTWEPLMDYIIQLSAGLSPIAVIRILRLLFETVQSDTDNCLLRDKPVRSGKLAKILKQYLQVLHIRVQHILKLQGTEERPYSRYLSSLLSYYVDLSCVHSSKVAKKGKFGRQLCGFVSYLLSPWPERILEAVLHSSVLVKEEKERASVLIPLIRKCVSLKPEAENHAMYLKYVLIVRKAKDALTEEEEVTAWAVTTRQLPAGSGFIDWLHEQCDEALEHMPVEDKKFKKTHITKFLLDEADDDLIDRLTDSFVSTVSRVTEENFLSMYNDTDGADAEKNEAGSETTVAEAVKSDTLFFLDTAGSKGTKKKKPKKTPVVLKTMDELESIVDGDQTASTSETQAYRLDSSLVEKFVHPADKEFVRSDIISITKMDMDSGKDEKDKKDDTAKAGNASAKKNKKKITREEVLTPSRSGKGRVKELHTRKKNNVQQMFVSETESDTSFTKAESKGDKQLKSVVCKINPEIKSVIPEETIIPVNSNELGSAILISDIEKSDTEVSEMTTDYQTISFAGSESECCPPNSTVEESEINSSIEITTIHCSDLSSVSQVVEQSDAGESSDVVLIDSDVEGTEKDSSSKLESITSQSIDNTTLSVFSNMETSSIKSDTLMSTDLTDEVLDSGNDDTLEITIKEKPHSKSTSGELQFQMDLSHTGERYKSPTSKKSPKTDRKSSSEVRLSSPKDVRKSPRKSRTSGSETANNSMEKDNMKSPIRGSMSEGQSQTEVKEDSSVFIEISDEEDKEADDKSPTKRTQNTDNTAIKCTKSAAEKFIEKAVKSKTPKKSGSKDTGKTNEEPLKMEQDSIRADANTRSKSTEEIKNIVEEIQHKLSTSSKKTTRRSEAKENAMFTDESTVSNDSDSTETNEISKAHKTRKKSSKSSSDTEKKASGDTSKKLGTPSPKKRSSKSSQSDQETSNVNIIDPKVHGSAKKHSKTQAELETKDDNTDKIVIKEGAILQTEEDSEGSVEQIHKVKNPEGKVASPNKTLKSPKSLRKKKTSSTSSETELTPSVKSPLPVAVHKKETPNKTPSSSGKKHKRSSDQQSPLPLATEAMASGEKKQRLSLAEDKETSPEKQVEEHRSHRRSVTKLKTPVSTEKKKQLKSYSVHQSLSDIKAKTNEKIDLGISSDLDDFVVPSSQTKSSRKSSILKSAEKKVLVQDSDSEKEVEISSKKTFLVSDSEDDDKLPDLGKFLKQTDEGLLRSPKISQKHAGKKTPQKKEKENKDENTDDEKANPAIASPPSRRTLRARQVPESQETSNKSVAEKSAAKSGIQSKRTSIAGRRKSMVPSKDTHDENESEKEWSESDVKTRRSVAGKKVAVKEPEIETTAQRTPQSKPALRKLSASTSKKAVPKSEELRLGRKRRLSGEMSASDRGSVGDSDQEISFPKIKKVTAVEAKASSRISKRLSTSAVPTEKTAGEALSRRYSLRKK